MGEVIANSPTPGVAAQLTTLGALIASSGTTSITTSAAVTGNLLNGNFRIVIGDGVQNSGAYETLLVTAGQSTTTWTVTRGVEGSTATTWNNSTPIYHVWTAAGIWGIPSLPLYAPLSGGFVALPYANGTVSASTVLMTNGLLYYFPFVITNSPTASAISVQSTTGGSANAVVRSGIYKDANGQPGTVLVDGGTVAATGTGALTASISQALSPGRYWAAVVAQGSPVTQVTLRRHVITGQQIQGTVPPDTLAHALTPTVYAGYTQTGVTGALPTAASLAAGDLGGGTFMVCVAVTF